MASLRLESVSKQFAEGTVALDRVSLQVGDGELLVLVGPSGCGKSTAMRIVAGLEPPTSGAVFIGSDDVTRLRPQDRDVAMVFQSYALYPHKTVRDNLAFGLRVRGVKAAEIARKVDEVAAMLELGPLLGRKPRALSGGQRQRVALGRAIARSPRLFILDEPLSNLDARLRLQTRTELGRLQRRLHATMLYVTHDQEEAMTLGDRVAVMRAGRLEQVGPPLEIYRRPANVFVAGFVGTPAMNLLPATLLAEGGSTAARGAGFAIDVPSALAARAADRAVIVGVRPQDLELGPPGAAAPQGRLDVVEALGREQLCHVFLDGGRNETTDLRVLAPPDTPLREGDPVGVHFRPTHLHLFDARTGHRIDASESGPGPL